MDRDAAALSGVCGICNTLYQRLDEDCDEVWLVDAPEDVRIRRVKERNGLEEGAIRRRIASQSQEFGQLPKERLSVLDNGGEVSLLRQIDSLLEKYK